jgi:hypothetical protein
MNDRALMRYLLLIYLLLSLLASLAVTLLALWILSPELTSMQLVLAHWRLYAVAVPVLAALHWCSRRFNAIVAGRR